MRAARLALHFISLFLVRAQVRILAPGSLVKRFPDTHGIIYGTTATFGAPYYGERVIGRLLYSKSAGEAYCSDADYGVDLPTPSTSENGQALVNVILVRRGKCSFAQKVKVAQAKQAHAVIVVDKEDSSLSADDIQHIVMADDGTGADIRIPSVLISRDDGKELIGAAQSGEVVVELIWDIPRGEVVAADFWMSSGSRETMEFLERFKDSAEMLGYHLQFIPHYHVFNLPEGVDSSSLGNLCLEKNLYCAPDPDGPGPVTGADVAMEDLRQLCIWRTTARHAPESPKGATYSQEFWEYVTEFRKRCPLKGTKPEKSFSERCSQKIMDSVGINSEEVLKCSKDNRIELLDEQLKNLAWSPQALRLNGWRYSGPLDPEMVLKAVCSGYTTHPAACEDLVTWHGSGVIMRHHPGLSFGTLLGGVFILGVCISTVFYFYRQHVTSSVRKVLREEVMLEVQTQMADYAPLEDAGQTPRGVLRF